MSHVFWLLAEDSKVSTDAALWACVGVSLFWKIGPSRVECRKYDFFPKIVIMDESVLVVIATYCKKLKWSFTIVLCLLENTKRQSFGVLLIQDHGKKNTFYNSSAFILCSMTR